MRKTTLDKQFLNIKQENKNLQKELDKIKAQEVKIGDIFRQELSFSTSGIAELNEAYNQAWDVSITSNNFYQVIARKGTRVTLQKINSEFVTYNHLMGRYVKPIKDSFDSDEIIIRKLIGDKVKIDHNAYAQKCNPEGYYYEKNRLV